MSDGDSQESAQDPLVRGPGLRAKAPAEESVGEFGDLAQARRADSGRARFGPSRRSRTLLVLGLGLAALLAIDGIVHWGEGGWRGWAARISWIGVICLAIAQALRLGRAHSSFAEAVRKGPAPILLTDRNGRIQLSNPAADRVLGVPAGSLVGRPVEGLFPLRYGANLASDRGLLLEGEGGHGGKLREVEILHADGSEQMVQIEQILLQALGGPLLQIAIRETSARVEQDFAQLQSTTLLETSRDAIISVDEFGVVKTWNNGAEAIYGRSAEDMLGLPLWMIAPPEREREVRRIISSVVAGTSVRDLHSEHVARDGRRLRVALSAGPMRTEAGDVQAVALSIRDVTEQRRAEALVVELDLALSDAMPGRARVDASGRVEWISEALLVILGVAPGLAGNDPVQEPWVELFPLGSRARLEAAYVQMLAQGKAHLTVQCSGEFPYTLDVLLVRRSGSDDQFGGHHLFAKEQSSNRSGVAAQDRHRAIGSQSSAR